MSIAELNGWKAQQYEKLKARIVELESENQNLLMANRKRCRDILDAIARKVAAGETVTIAPDCGLGSGTLVMEDEGHTHFGLDIYEDEGQSVDSFVEGLHSLLVEGRGLSVAGGKVEDLPSPFLDRGAWLRQNLPAKLGFGTYVDGTLPPGTIEFWSGGKRVGRITGIRGE